MHGVQTRMEIIHLVWIRALLLTCLRSQEMAKAVVKKRSFTSSFKLKVVEYAENSSNREAVEL